MVPATSCTAQHPPRTLGQPQPRQPPRSASTLHPHLRSRGAEQPQLLQWLLPNVTSARSTPPVLCVGSVMMGSGDLGHSSNLANMSDDLYLEDFDDTSIFENKVRYILS